MSIPTDRQGMFNHVVINLRKQGKVSQGYIAKAQATTCMYRVCDGFDPLSKEPYILRCGAGWLIPDEDYKESFEGQAVYNPPGEQGARSVQEYFTDKYGEDNLTFIQELQNIHDGETGSGEALIAKWNRKWSDFASRYYLKMPV